MMKAASCPKITGMQASSGRWFLCLPDPFGPAWYPLDAVTLAEMLDISPKTGQRICQGVKALRPCELVYLQVMVFGLIPDPAFERLGMFFQGGVLYSRQLPGVALSPGSLAEWQAQRQAFYGLMTDLEMARVRIAELEGVLNPAPVVPSNVIRFPGR
jgi:hypothetical protein